MSRSNTRPRPARKRQPMTPGSSTTTIDDGTVARLAASTVGYVRARLIGDDSTADLIRDTLGPDLLILGLTSALTSTVRASGDPDAFLDELLSGFAPRSSGAAAFVRGV